MKTLYDETTQQSFLVKGEFLAIKFLDLNQLDLENKVIFNQEYLEWYKEFLNCDVIVLEEQNIKFLKSIEELSYEEF